MYPLYFSAVLQTEDGRLLEFGEACVSDTECTIDFVSDFVPLMKLGETARVVRTLGDREFEVFTGKVYLSSRKLLQIVEVPQPVILAARRMFSTNENISTGFSLVQNPTHYNLQKCPVINGTIRYIAEDLIKIIAMEYIPEEQYLVFTVRTQSINLEQMTIQVKQRVLLKRNAAVLLCDPVAPADANRRALASFLNRSRRPTTA